MRPLFIARFLTFLAFLSVFSVFYPHETHAEAVSVTVAEKGTDASIARAKAMAEAEQKAFRKLLQEKVPEKADTILSSYDEAHISQLVQGYEVEEETITDTSYHAKLIINFNGGLIQSLLNPDSRTRSAAATTVSTNMFEADETEAILLIPVYRDGSSIMLWEKENKWRDVLNNAALQLGFKRLVMPYGDPTDRLIVDASNISSASYHMLSGLAQRYGARDIIVATAEPEYGSKPAAINTDIRMLSPTATQKHHFRMAGKQVNDVMKRSAEQVVTGISDIAGLSAEEEENAKELYHFKAMVQLSHVREWIELRSRLQQISEIEEIDVITADWRSMVVSLAYRGEPEMFGKQLAAADISVEKNANQLKLSIR